jgi:type I restriction enzyme S subunit
VIQRGELNGFEIPSRKQRIVHSGQLILSRIDARHGAFGLIPDYLDGAIVSTDFPVFDIERSQIVPRWLEWFCKTPKFIQICEAASKGTTNRVRLKEEVFLATKVCLPNISEQERVASEIDKIDSKIRKAKDLRGEAERSAAALIGSFLYDVFAKCREPEWKQVALLDLVEMRPGFACGAKSMTEGFPHLRMNNISSDGRIDLSLLRRAPVDRDRALKYFLKRGDVLFNNTNSLELVGKTALFNLEDPEFVFSNHLTRLRPKGSSLNSDWLVAYLQHLWHQRFFERNCNKWINQAAFNGKRLAKLEVPLPGLQEQESTLDRLRRLEEKVRDLRRDQQDVSVGLETLRGSILRQAFSTEL